jgi:hypothetical protein
LGTRIGYTFVEEWGLLTPTMRFEYLHAFGGNYSQGLGYTDPGAIAYDLTGNLLVQNQATAALGLKATLFDKTSFDTEYEVTAGSSHTFAQTWKGSIRVGF